MKYIVEFERKQWQRVEVEASSMTEAVRLSLAALKEDKWDSYGNDPYAVEAKEAA